MAYLSPDLVQKALSISSNYKNGGMVAKFQDGGEISEDDLAAAVTEADDLNEALDSFDDRDSGDDNNNRDYEEAVADALAGGMDLNTALDLADETFGGDGDGDTATPAAPRDESPATPTKTAAEAIMSARGLPVDPAIQEAVKRQAAVQAARPTVPGPQDDDKKVTEAVREKVVQTPIDFLSTTSVTPPSPYEQGTLRAGYTKEDLAKAEADLRAAQFDAPPTFGAAAGKPRMSEAGIVGGIVDAITNPEATLANAISQYGIGSLNNEETGQKGGLDVVTVGDRTAAYDPERNIVYDTKPFEGLNPFGDEKVPEGIQALYDKKNAKDQEERERGGDDEPILEEEVAVEEEETAPEKPPTIDIVPFRPQDFYYFYPRQQYGLPSMMNMRTE